MATRAKPKEIVAESQKFFDVEIKVHDWAAIILAVITILTVIMWGINDHRREKSGDVVSKGTQQQKFLGAQIPLASSSSAVPTAGCPQYGSARAEECMVTEAGIILSTTEVMNPGEFELCHVLPRGGTFKPEWLNTSTLKLVSTTGPFPIRYRLFKGGCPKTF